MASHLIGLMLGLEDDWPTAFESLLGRAKLDINHGGERHTFTTERVTIEPFDLRMKPRHRLVIDRLAWWYFMPREWLKKIAMMDEVYLLNDPFTFQSMEKHTAYCAMMRLGLHIPETWMLPNKSGPENERYPGTSRRYNRLFSLEQVAEEIGYPLFMKPFDGGAWVGVTRVNDARDLHRAYDASGQRLMHLQKAILDYDVFVRSLSIGPQTRLMKYRPERPLHDRYDVGLDFLDESVAEEVESIGRVVNAFFRWEFNSCETLVKGGVVSPIDYANACPDVSVISLHAHFPWAITALLRWSVFCAASGRKMAIDMDKRRYFEIADRADLSYAQKIAEYRRLSDEYFNTGGVGGFEEFCGKHLAHLDEVAHEYFTGGEFDELLVRTVRDAFRPHEQEQFVSHYRQMIALWADGEGSRKNSPQRHREHRGKTGFKPEVPKVEVKRSG